MFDSIESISQSLTAETKNENERIFSYKMSKLINLSELQQVSGGQNRNDNGTSRGTGRATYSQRGGQDFEADVDYDL